jgi:hypothetical protein
MLQSMWLRVMQLWVVVLVLILSGVPAWAIPSQHRSRDGKQKAGRDASSIQLTTKRVDLSFLSQMLVDVPLEKKEKKARQLHKSHELVGRAEPGLRTEHHGTSRHAGIGHEPNGRGHRVHEHGHVRGQPSHPTPGSNGEASPGSSGGASPGSSGGASPIPEPSSLMFFGVGLLLARRAIGVRRAV